MRRDGHQDIDVGGGEPADPRVLGVVLGAQLAMPGVTRMRRPPGWRSASSSASAEAKPTGFEL